MSDFKKFSQATLLVITLLAVLAGTAIEFWTWFFGGN